MVEQGDEETARGAQAPPPGITPTAVVQSRYEVLELLGRGGMGTVERVRDRRSEREVALKRLRLDDAPASRRTRLQTLFEQEFHVLSQLRHPRTIRVYDYGIDSLGPYYTMEILAGQDVSQLAPMPVSQVCVVGRDVASSLAVLHNRGFVHRDVTPSNIRWLQGEQAKLLDFGAMTRAGAVTGVAGTPPCVPPEAMREGTLDGRADIYALGATLYYCLTGRHAYPARRIDQLHVLWAQPLVPPSAYGVGLPAALSDLVMEMLCPQPAGRPPNAAAVFERLSSIGDLPRVEGLEVPTAHLASPTLVGREALLQRGRDFMAAALADRGGHAFLVRGAPGSGRTRVLSRMASVARQLGVPVLRIEAAPNRGEFGALRALLEGLVELRPKLRQQAPALGRILDGQALGGAQRRDAIAAATRALHRVARRRRVVVLVDDFNRADEATRVVLAAFASEARRGHLALMCAADLSSSEELPELSLLEQAAEVHDLPALSLDASQELLASLFGTADHLTTLASVMHGRTEGNPGEMVRLAHALVEAGVLRYSAGAWVLPPAADDIRAALPHDASLQERARGVTGMPRRLMAQLAADIQGGFDPLLEAERSDAAARAEVLAAADALEAAQVLTRRDGTWRLAAAVRRQDLAAALDAEELAAAHRVLQAFYARRGALASSAHHALQAGDPLTARALFLTPPDDRLLERWLTDSTAVRTADRLVEQLSAMDPEDPALVRVRCRLTQLCSATEAWESVVRHGPATVEALSRRCGLWDFAQLTEVPVAQRLSEAVTRAEARHAAALQRTGTAPEQALSLTEAFKALSPALLLVTAASTMVESPQLAAGLPSLEPLYPLSTAFPVVQRLIDAIRGIGRGEADQSLHALRDILAVLDAGLDGVEQRVIVELAEFARAYLQGIEACMANPQVLERNERKGLRRARRAARERYVYYWAVGDSERAARMGRQLERLDLESGTHTFPGAWEVEYTIYALTQDLDGLRRVEAQAVRLAETYPGWAARVELTRVCRDQCGAPSEATIARALRLVETLPPGVTTRRLALYEAAFGMLRLGQPEACRKLMQAEVDRLGREPHWHEGFLIVLAEAEAQLGMVEQARAHAEAHCRMYIAAGVRGVLLGRMHESMARVALALGDEEAFRTHAEKCAELYRAGFNPALTRRYELLMRHATAHRLHVDPELASSADFPERPALTEADETLRSALSSVHEERDRNAVVLSMLVERYRAAGGGLYLLSKTERPSLLARVGAMPTGDGVLAAVEAYWCGASIDDDVQTEMLTQTGVGSGEDLSVASVDGCGLRLCMLVSESGPPRAMLVLVEPDPEMPPPDVRTLLAVASAIETPA